MLVRNRPSIGRLRTAALALQSHFALLTLLTVLLRSPAITRILTHFQAAIEPASRLIQRLAITASSLGAYHAVSGATTAEYSTNPRLPISIEIGQSLLFGFSVTQTEEDASSWSVTGEIPPGLTVSGSNDEPLSSLGVFNAQFGKITGTPTQPGSFTLFLKPWRDPNASGPTAEALEANFTILGPDLIPAPIRVDASSNLFLVYWQASEFNQYTIQRTATPDDESSWTDYDLPIQSEGNSRSISIPTTTTTTPLYIRILSHY